MSLVDYASSSDDEGPEPAEEEPKEEGPQLPQRDSPPPPPSQTQTKSGSSLGQLTEKKPHLSPPSAPSVEKLPDASLLLNSSAVTSGLMYASNHSARVAAAQAENASRKRDSNGMVSSAVRRKVPKGNLPPSRNLPDTGDGMLVPPQISGRKNVVTEDLSKLFVKKQNQHASH